MILFFQFFFLTFLLSFIGLVIWANIRLFFFLKSAYAFLRRLVIILSFSINKFKPRSLTTHNKLIHIGGGLRAGRLPLILCLIRTYRRCHLLDLFVDVSILLLLLSLLMLGIGLLGLFGRS